MIRSEWRKHLENQILLIVFQMDRFSDTMLTGIWIAAYYSKGGLNTSSFTKWLTENQTGVLFSTAFA